MGIHQALTGGYKLEAIIPTWTIEDTDTNNGSSSTMSLNNLQANDIMIYVASNDYAIFSSSISSSGFPSSAHFPKRYFLPTGWTEASANDNFTSFGNIHGFALPGYVWGYKVVTSETSETWTINNAWQKNHIAFVLRGAGSSPSINIRAQINDEEDSTPDIGNVSLGGNYSICFMLCFSSEKDSNLTVPSNSTLVARLPGNNDNENSACIASREISASGTYNLGSFGNGNDDEGNVLEVFEINA